ncbi:MAG: ATP-dependent helicase, partial [Desulfomonilaceae bacterium]
MSRYVDFEKQLNPSQFEAVSVGEGPVLVVAGAGSGKTRTIVYRVAWLVNKGVPPSAILLMTFTRKAAQEMLSRASDLIQTELWDVAGGTFHSTANLVLRRYAKYLQLDPSYAIMDQSDTIAALDHIKKDQGGAGKLPKGFPKSRTIADVISRSSGAESSIEDVLKRRYPHFTEFASLIEQIYESYTAYKRLNNLLDYDDLLIHFKTLLETSVEVREQLSQRWRHILVDEYQDTNPLQGRIVRLLAYAHENVMAVGDDSQSIYSFRGADFRNIMEFPNIFHGTRLIRLEENYRSTQQILHLTNSLIARAATGYPKVLFSNKK